MSLLAAAAQQQTLGGGGSFTDPSDFGSNLVLWLDADAITGLSDGDTLVTWADQSTYGNDATQRNYTDTAAATTWKYRTAGPSAECTTDNGDFMRVSHDSSVDLTTAGTVYVVAKCDVTTNTGAAAIMKDPHPTSVGSSQWYMLADGRAGLDTSGVDSNNNWPTSAIGIRAFVWDSSTLAVRENGVQEASGSSGGGAVSTTEIVSLGGRNRASFTFLGHFYEVVMVDRKLSASEIDDLEDYLATKWGVTI